MTTPLVENITTHLLAAAPGPRGFSAYQTAVQNGFVGTEAEWIASLKGVKGDQGPQGIQGVEGLSAYQVALAAGFEGTEDEWLASLGKARTRTFDVKQSAYNEMLIDAHWVPLTGGQVSIREYFKLSQFGYAYSGSWITNELYYLSQATRVHEGWNFNEHGQVESYQPILYLLMYASPGDGQAKRWVRFLPYEGAGSRFVSCVGTLPPANAAPVFVRRPGGAVTEIRVWMTAPNSPHAWYSDDSGHTWAQVNNVFSLSVSSATEYKADPHASNPHQGWALIPVPGTKYCRYIGANGDGGDYFDFRPTALSGNYSTWQERLNTYTTTNTTNAYEPYTDNYPLDMLAVHNYGHVGAIVYVKGSADAIVINGHGITAGHEYLYRMGNLLRLSTYGQAAMKGSRTKGIPFGFSDIGLNYPAPVRRVNTSTTFGAGPYVLCEGYSGYFMDPGRYVSPSTLDPRVGFVSSPDPRNDYGDVIGYSESMQLFGTERAVGTYEQTVMPFASPAPSNQSQTVDRLRPLGSFRSFLIPSQSNVPPNTLMFTGLNWSLQAVTTQLRLPNINPIPVTTYMYVDQLFSEVPPLPYQFPFHVYWPPLEEIPGAGIGEPQWGPGSQAHWNGLRMFDQTYDQWVAQAGGGEWLATQNVEWPVIAEDGSAEGQPQVSAGQPYTMPMLWDNTYTTPNGRAITGAITLLWEFYSFMVEEGEPIPSASSIYCRIGFSNRDFSGGSSYGFNLYDGRYLEVITPESGSIYPTNPEGWHKLAFWIKEGEPIRLFLDGREILAPIYDPETEQTIGDGPFPVPNPNNLLGVTGITADISSYDAGSSLPASRRPRLRRIYVGQGETAEAALSYTINTVPPGGFF